MQLLGLLWGKAETTLYKQKKQTLIKTFISTRARLAETLRKHDKSKFNADQKQDPKAFAEKRRAIVRSQRHNEVRFEADMDELKQQRVRVAGVRARWFVRWKSVALMLQNEQGCSLSEREIVRARNLVRWKALDFAHILSMAFMCVAPSAHEIDELRNLKACAYELTTSLCFHSFQLFYFFHMYFFTFM